MTDKYSVKDINKNIILVSINIQQMRLSIQKLYSKDNLIFFFAYLCKNKIISSWEFQESLTKNMLCRSSYVLLALEEFNCSINTQSSILSFHPWRFLLAFPVMLLHSKIHFYQLTTWILFASLTHVHKYLMEKIVLGREDSLFAKARSQL